MPKITEITNESIKNENLYFNLKKNSSNSLEELNEFNREKPNFLNIKENSSDEITTKKNYKKEKRIRKYKKNIASQIYYLKLLKNNNTKKFNNFNSIFEKDKEYMHKKFLNNMEKIILFFNKIGINFEEYNLPDDENPLILLKSLSCTQNILARKKILNKIEVIIENL